MLRLAFVFVPLGLIFFGLVGFGVLSPATGFHLPGIGGFGGMTLAVMVRASLLPCRAGTGGGSGACWCLRLRLSGGGGAGGGPVPGGAMGGCGPVDNRI